MQTIAFFGMIPTMDQELEKAHDCSGICFEVEGLRLYSLIGELHGRG